MASIKRLKRLITVLERVKADPKKRREFDMSAWAEVVPECGTHHCACGWAAMDPVLRKQGLWLTKPRRARTLLFGLSENPVSILRFRRHRNYDAAAAFFEIDVYYAHYLFDPDRYLGEAPGIGAVIKRIRDFVREQEKLAA